MTSNPIRILRIICIDPTTFINQRPEASRCVFNFWHLASRRNGYRALPVDRQKATIHAFLNEIIPFSEAEAVESARLFNAVERKRSLKVNAMIAGTAIRAKARLATQNRQDFAVFISHGLELLPARQT